MKTFLYYQNLKEGKFLVLTSPLTKWFPGATYTAIQIFLNPQTPPNKSILYTESKQRFRNPVTLLP